MKTCVTILAIVVFVLAIVAPATRATQVLYRSPEQLGQQSSHVVLGKVHTVRSFWNDKRTKIFTETEIVVDETFKGNGLSSLRLLQLGGVVDNVRVTVAGALQWRTGEEVLLFVEPYVNGTYQVSGFSQGKYAVERDPQSGSAFVRQPDSKDVQLLGSPAATSARKRSRVEKKTVEQFVNQALGRN